MRCTFLVILVFSILNTRAQTISLETPVKFLALGDSYTIGESVDGKSAWPYQLSELLQDKAIRVGKTQIIAKTGWRTDDLIDKIKSTELHSDFNLVAILIGVNNQYQSKPFSQYENEFPVIFELALQKCNHDSSRIFIVSIPDYYYTPFGLTSKKGNTISEELSAYNTFAKSFADQMGVPFVDITPISQKREEKLVATDGLHPSAFQYKLWVEKIIQELDF